MDTQAKINTDRDALYRREARGDVVNPEEWMALGDRQTAASAHLFDARGLMTTITPEPSEASLAAARSAILATEATMARIMRRHGL